MELSGAVTRRSGSFRLGSIETLALRRKRSGVLRQRVAFDLRPWADEDHRIYYAASVRCGSAVDAKRKEEKKKAALVKVLPRDLGALYSMEFGMEGEEGVTGEVREKMMRELVGLLKAELNHLKAKEKEKKKKKDEEAVMKAAKNRNCAKEDSSSSSSSESSDSECDEVVDTIQKTNVLQEVKPASLAFPEQFPEFRQKLPSTQLKANDKVEIIHTPFQLDQGCSSSDSFTCAAVTSYSGSVVAYTEPLAFPEVIPSPPKPDGKVEAIRAPLKLDEGHSSGNSFCTAAAPTCCGGEVTDAKRLNKIEVCMGGKCKKSGAMELLQEFEKQVGIQGAVVGCKCMGKCKQGGPNVRFVKHDCSQEEHRDPSKKTLCIGVGLEDVSAIVAAFFGHKDADLGLLASYMSTANSVL